MLCSQGVSPFLTHLKIRKKNRKKTIDTLPLKHFQKLVRVVLADQLCHFSPLHPQIWHREGPKQGERLENESYQWLIRLIRLEEAFGSRWRHFWRLRSTISIPTWRVSIDGLVFLLRSGWGGWMIWAPRRKTQLFAAWKLFFWKITHIFWIIQMIFQ